MTGSVHGSTPGRPSTDLTVPQAARAAFADQHNLPAPSDGFRGAVDWAAVDADIRAISAPVVAQFLRDLAARHDRVSGDLLADLADGLDGGARDE